MASKTIGAGRITFRYGEDIGMMMHEMMERDHTDRYFTENGKYT